MKQSSGDSCDGNALVLSSGGAGRSLVVLLVHSLFQLFLYVVLCVVELADTTAQTAHEFRDLATAKQHQDCQDDQEPLASARHRNQKIAKHNKRSLM